MANIYFNDGCFVETTFSVNNIKYVITRYKDCPKSNLKIIINDVDRSGKGIRESQALLEEYLPELTHNLLCSVVFMGQGLPNRFSSNTPSGRKEILEKLSNSDFMIQDLKDRINKRTTKLSTQLRIVEDNLLENRTLKVEKKTRFNKLQEQFKALNNNIDFDTLIAEEQKNIEENNNLYNKKQEQYNKIEKDIKALTQQLIEASSLKDKDLDNLEKSYDDSTRVLKENKESCYSDILYVSNEIKQMKNIVDVCPTCNQKIPNVYRPDTSKKEQELEDLNVEYSKILELLETYHTQYDEKREELVSKFENDAFLFRESINTLEKEKTQYLKDLSLINDIKLKAQMSLQSYITSKLNYEQNKKDVLEEIESIKDFVDKLINEEKNLLDRIEELKKHIEVINKINSLIKRDFRGVLLSNVIDFINSKSKEYSKELFNTDEIEFKLNGNNIDIVFCSKDYSVLSGGEKRKIDIIVQFSLRDMLCQYLDFSSNILCLDEITDNLDSYSVEKVLNLISTKLTDVDSLFIITQHEELVSGFYDEYIIVIKDERGISRIA